MPDYRIYETDEIIETIARLPQNYIAFFKKKLEQYMYSQLSQEPFFGGKIKKLRGSIPDIWRYRIGEFRIFYTINTEEHIVYILSVDFRRNAYR